MCSCTKNISYWIGRSRSRPVCGWAVAGTGNRARHRVPRLLVLVRVSPARVLHCPSARGAVPAGGSTPRAHRPLSFVRRHPLLARGRSTLLVSGIKLLALVKMHVDEVALGWHHRSPLVHNRRLHLVLLTSVYSDNHEISGY